MRILLLCHFYFPEVGAAAKRTQALVARWTRCGHDVRVITGLPHYPVGVVLPGESGRHKVWRSETGPSGETVVRVPFLPTRRGGMFKLADQAVVALGSVAPLARWKPDVIVASLPGVPTMLPAVAARARWRSALVIEMRDAWPEVAQAAGVASSRLTNGLGVLMTKVQRSADAVVTTAGRHTEALVARGVARERLHHIPNGIDAESVPFLGPPAVASGPLRVLYLGTHGVAHGLPAVVRALAALPQGTAVARFIGHGTEKQALMALARSMDAPITFEDPVNGTDLWDAYRWAQVCLVATHDWPAHHYTVPFKLYEILGSGRFCLGALTGEAASILAASDAGLVVPPDNETELAGALLRLAENPHLLDVDDRGRRHILKHYSLPVLADRYLTILETVVDRRRDNLAA